MNKGIVLSSIFLICVGFCVSRVKYEVVFLKDRLKDINSKIDKCSDDLKVYNAEWSYLNDPKRLKTLCTKYLPNLRPTENTQVISYETIVTSDLERDANKALGSFLDEAISNDMEDQ